MQVEPCRPFGAAEKPRAWSKYSKDSSAYKRAHGEEEKPEKSSKSDDFEEPSAKKSKDDAKFDQFMEAKGVGVEKEVKLSKDKSEEAKKLMNELMDGIEGGNSQKIKKFRFKNHKNLKKFLFLFFHKHTSPYN